MLDSQHLYCDDQAVTATAASTDYINHKATSLDFGAGNSVDLEVICTTAMTDTGSDSTVTVTIEQDDNSAFSSATTVATVGTFAATSAIGTKLTFTLSPGQITEQYSRLQLTVAGGNLSTGSFTGGYVQKANSDTKAYPVGYTVS